MQNCPCGSGRDYTQCCEPVIDGTQPARTAGDLMRARYTAYVKDRIEFLGQSLHPDSRADYDAAATRRWAQGADWLGLEVEGVDKGDADDVEGSVEFVASYREKGLIHAHRERSLFRRLDGRWYFVEGTPIKGETQNRSGPKVGRNDPCPCGSGKKFKRCCGGR